LEASAEVRGRRQYRLGPGTSCQGPGCLPHFGLCMHNGEIFRRRCGSHKSFSRSHLRLSFRRRPYAFYAYYASRSAYGKLEARICPAIQQKPSTKLPMSGSMCSGAPPGNSEVLFGIDAQAAAIIAGNLQNSTPAPSVPGPLSRSPRPLGDQHRQCGLQIDSSDPPVPRGPTMCSLVR